MTEAWSGKGSYFLYDCSGIDRRVRRRNMRREFVVFSILACGGIGLLSQVWPPILWAFLVIGPIVLIGFYDFFQPRRTLLRNFPIFGRGRYMMESLRPKIYQYFIIQKMLPLQM